MSRFKPWLSFGFIDCLKNESTNHETMKLDFLDSGLKVAKQDGHYSFFWHASVHNFPNTHSETTMHFMLLLLLTEISLLMFLPQSKPPCFIASTITGKQFLTN